MKKKILGILLLFWLCLIFFMSAKPGDESQEMSYNVGKFVCKIVVPSYKNMPEEKQLAMAKAIDFPIRKAAHVTEFAILGGLLMLFLGELWINRKNFWIAVACGIFYAATDEFHQLFVPGRGGKIMDVGIDSIGVLIGVSLIYFLAKKKGIYK